MDDQGVSILNKKAPVIRRVLFKNPRFFKNLLKRMNTSEFKGQNPESFPVPPIRKQKHISEMNIAIIISLY